MRIEHVSPNAVDARGGTVLTLDGDFPPSTPLQVRLTVSGQDTLAYAGVAGQGTRAYVYGSSFSVVTPALPPGVAAPADATVRVELADDPSQNASWATALQVLPPTYGSQVFALRGLFPPVDATGPRSMAAVQTQQGPLPGAVLPHILDAFGECFTAFGGTRSSFATQAAAKGSAALVVQSTLGTQTGGQLLVHGVVYTFDSVTSQGYTGLRPRGSATPGLLDDVAAGDEIVDVTPGSRLLGQLHESTFLSSADGADLSVCGRNLGLTRDPAIRDDATYAAACQAIAYGPRGTMLGLRTALDAMVGAGNYRLREDTLNNPCRVFADLPQSLTLGQTSTGRTYLSGPRPVLPADAQTFEIPSPVYGLNRIVRPDVDDTQAIGTTRPGPPWQYSGNDENADVGLHPDSPGLSCIRFSSTAGTYRAARDAADAAGQSLSVTLRQTPGSPTTPNANTGLGFGVHLSGRVAAVAVGTDAAGQLRLFPCRMDGTAIGTRFIRLRSDAFVECALSPLPRSEDWELSAAGRSLRITPTSHTGTFTGAFVGRLASADAGTPSVDVSALRAAFRPVRNYAQAIGTSAQVQSSQPAQVVLEQPLAQKMQPGQSIHLGGSQVPVRAPGVSSGPAGSNDGDYTVVSVDSAVSLTLRRFSRSDGVLGSSGNAVNQLDLPKPVFSYPGDLGRQVTIGGNGSNAGTYFVSQLVDAQGNVCALPYARPCASARLVKSDGSVPNFVSQTKVSVDVRPSFVSESNLSWVIDQGFDLVLDGYDMRVSLWQPLPDDSVLYDVTYNDHLGSTVVEGNTPVVVLQDEGPPPTFNIYPFYVSDALSFVNAYLSELTAAGVRAVVNLI